jgi:hypothetical protein
VEQLDPLRPETWQRGDFTKLPRQLFLQGVEQVKMAALDNVRNLVGQVLTDPRQFRQVTARGQQACHALRQRIDHARRPPIGADAKRVFSLDIEELGGLVEHGRDFSILNRHGSGPLLQT